MGTGVEGRGREAGCPAPPAQIPACGFPAPGSCLGSSATALPGSSPFYLPPPTHGDALDACSPALCPEGVLPPAFPLTGRLPSTPSATFRLCSGASTVLCTRPTPHSRASSACAHSGFPTRSENRPRRSRMAMRPPRFRRHPSVRDVVSDPGGATAPRVNGAAHVACDHVQGLGLRGIISFVAQ